eukprot:9470838-Pyramimonas_sp.AAC.2
MHLWGVECVLAVIGTGGPVKRSTIYIPVACTNRRRGEGSDCSGCCYLEVDGQERGLPVVGDEDSVVVAVRVTPARYMPDRLQRRPRQQGESEVLSPPGPPNASNSQSPGFTRVPLQIDLWR